MCSVQANSHGACPPETALTYCPLSTKTMIHEGGLVPKTLYKMNSLEDHDDEVTAELPTTAAAQALVPGKRLSANQQHDHRNLYKSVDLKAGFAHELLIRNEDPKSVLTWDFDVMRNDLHFTLYRVTQELPEKNGELIMHLQKVFMLLFVFLLF